MLECEDLVVEVAALFKASFDALKPMFRVTGKCDLKTCIPLL